MQNGCKVKFLETVVNGVSLDADMPNALRVGTVPVGVYADIEKIYRSPLAGITNKVARLHWPCLRYGRIETVDP
jgi:hypothetical protein